MKYDNDFEAFTEDRTWQRKSWLENQNHFLKFLCINKLYAYGSYYFLLLKYLILEI